MAEQKYKKNENSPPGMKIKLLISIHYAIPFIAMLRKSVNMPKSSMAFTIAMSILGYLTIIKRKSLEISK